MVKKVKKKIKFTYKIVDEGGPVSTHRSLASARLALRKYKKRHPIRSPDIIRFTKMGPPRAIRD